MLWIAAFGWLGSIACERTVPEQGPLELEVADEGRLMTLSHSPYAVAAGMVHRDSVIANLRIGGVEDGFGQVADVFGLAGGEFGVLDRWERSVVLFNADGVVRSRFGREGGGPGEFTMPIAATAFGERLVVWDWSPNKPFSVFGLDGDLLDTAPELVEGDWRILQFREPFSYDAKPFQWTWEDTSRRLVTIDGTHFGHLIQPDERKDPSNSARLAVHFVRYDQSGSPRDTVANSWAPPSLRQPGIPGALPMFTQQFFAGRPLWAAGEGWIAVSHGDSSGVRIIDHGRSLLARIVWPEHRTHTIGRREKERHVDWYISEKIVRLGSAETRDGFRRMTKQHVAQMREKMIAEEPFADSVPRVTALYGDGNCIWISGFSLEDHPTGTALTWIGVDVVRKRLVGVKRVPRAGSRAREVKDGMMYTTYRDDDAMTYLERFSLQASSCQPSP